MPQNFPVPNKLPEEDTLIDFPWDGLKKLNNTVCGLGQMKNPRRDIIRKKLKVRMKALITSILEAKEVNHTVYCALAEKAEGIKRDMQELEAFEFPLAKKEHLEAKAKYKTAIHNTFVFQGLRKKMDTYIDFVKSCEEVVDSYGLLPPHGEIEVGELE
ncbi:hypothetical protein EAF04_003403 [Stromatinia cepivora]|nr:hypothetical protein EAF04_003403 [Stromatinia cepivora]